MTIESPNPPEGAAAASDEDDHTIMVNRESADEDAGDHTVMVNRGAPSPAGVDDADDPEDPTVVVDREPAHEGRTDDESDEQTVMVDGNAHATRGLAIASRHPQKTSRRRGIAPPPAPAGFGPLAVKAVGADATETYRPREVATAPAPAPAPAIVEGTVLVEGTVVTKDTAIAEDPAATREASKAMPSVERHARVTARVAIAVFVSSCVVSVVGLTLIAFALF